MAGFISFFVVCFFVTDIGNIHWFCFVEFFLLVMNVLFVVFILKLKVKLVALNIWL